MKENKQSGKRKIIIYAILAMVLLAGSVYGYNYIQFLSAHQDTDNAQVDGNIVPVISRVGSYVAEVYVNDNERVQKGELLMELDPADLHAKYEQATTALEVAKAALLVAKSDAGDALENSHLALTSVESPKTNLWKAQKEYQRYSELYKQNATTAQQLDNAKANLENAQAQYDVAKQKHESSELQYQTSLNRIKVSEANVHQKQREVEYAQLQLSYTRVVAPVSGIISKKSIQPGQLIQAGQPVMSIVQDSDIWVTANFKETQLEKMKVGEPVKIEVDAYPHVNFDGTLESIGGATGAKFSLLPPDNAAGNFVKVVQRIPVKVRINPSEEARQLLKPGLSVRAIVNVQ